MQDPVSDRLRTNDLVETGSIDPERDSAVSTQSHG